jgi:hypothetical protein
MTKPDKLIVLATDPKYNDGGLECLIWDDCNARVIVSPAQMRHLIEECADDERRLDFILETWLDLAEQRAKGKIDLDALCPRSSQLHRYRVIVVIVDPDDARGVDVRTDGDGNMHVFIGHVFMEEIEEMAEVAGTPLVEEVINLAIQVQRVMQDARRHQQTKN